MNTMKRAHEIRRIRKAIGVNREDFGALIGVSKSSVIKYELDKRNPGTAVIMNIKRIKLMHEKGALRK